MVDEEPFVDGLVEEATLLVGTASVEVTAAVEEFEGDVEPFPDEGLVSGGLSNLALSIGDLGQGLVLALLELAHGDGVSEVGVDQFGLGVLEVLEPFLLLGDDLLAVCGLEVEVLLDSSLDALRGGLGDDLAVPVVLDGLDHVGFGEVREVAVGALLVAAEAEEVAVALPVLSSGGAVAEPLPTP